MTTSRLRAAVALILVAVAFSACGEDGPTGPSFADSVSTEDAASFGSNVGYAASDMAELLNFREPSIGLAAEAVARLDAERPFGVRAFGTATRAPRPALIDWRTVAADPAGVQAAAAAEGCTITIRGITMGGAVDVNQNGIPDDLYVKQECSVTDSTSSPDTTFVNYQLVEQGIRENFSSLFGYTVAVKQKSRYSDDRGNWEGFEVTFGQAADIRSSSASSRYSVSVMEGYDWGGESHINRTGSNWNAGFDPDGSIVLGSALPDGDLTLSGRDWFSNEPEGLSLSFSLETLTPLAFNAACYDANGAFPFTAGVLRGLLNGNSGSASFTATFTACGVSPTVTTEGTYDEVATTR